MESWNGDPGRPSEAELTYWGVTTTTGTVCTYLYTVAAPRAPEPLPFFLDPEQIAALTPEINWSERVGDRIRAFLAWGRSDGLTDA